MKPDRVKRVHPILIQEPEPIQDDFSWMLQIKRELCRIAFIFNVFGLALIAWLLW